MKKAKILLAVLTLSVAMSFTSLAAEWKQDTIGWWYQNDDGSYLLNQWQTIDGKMYFFGADGYMLFNTVTPDGYFVGIDGIWDGQPAKTSNNILQTTTVETKSTTSTATAPSGISLSLYEGYTIIVNTNSKKYHVPTCNSVLDISQGNLGYCSDASYLDSQGYAACKKCH